MLTRYARRFMSGLPAKARAKALDAVFAWPGDAGIAVDKSVHGIAFLSWVSTLQGEQRCSSYFNNDRDLS